MTNVNRRPGSISECESWWSIGQKFSFLNRVSFTEFMFRIQREGKTQSKAQSYHQILVNGADETAAAALLEEPIQTFRYSGDTVYIPDFLRKFHPVVQNLRYCPTCIELGFHSPAHQLPWFDKCLLHGCTLVTGCPSCGKRVSYLYDRYAQYRVDRYHCPCGQPIWNDLLLPRWRKSMGKSTLQPVITYLDWIRNMRFPGYNSLSEAIKFLIVHDPHNVEPAWIMRCLSSISDIPAEVRVALSGTTEPHILRTNSVDVKPSTILAAINQFGYQTLLQSYRLWSEQTNLSPMQRPLVKSIRKYLLGRHTLCLNKQRHIMGVREHYLYYSTEGYCPHAISAHVFERRWATLHDDDRYLRYRKFAFEVADSLKNLGIVSYSRDTSKQYDWHWSSCGRAEFVGDYALNIHVSQPLAQLLDRLWALEMFKNAYIINDLMTKGGPAPVHPFDGTISNPLVLLEAGPDDTLSIWIWTRLPLRNLTRTTGARTLRRHKAKVAKLTADEEAKIVADGHPLDRR